MSDYITFLLWLHYMTKWVFRGFKRPTPSTLWGMARNNYRYYRLVKMVELSEG